MKTRTHPRRTWITIGLITLIIILLAYFVDWGDVLTLLQATNWPVLLVGVIFLIIGLILLSVRWRYILGNKPPLRKTFHADSIGYMTTVLSPMPASAVRLVALTQSTEVSFPSAIPAIFIESLLRTIMRILALILVIVLSLSLDRALISIFVGVVLIIAVLGFIIWLVSNPDRFIPKIAELLSRAPGINRDRLDQPLSDLQSGLSSLGSIKRIVIALSLSMVMWGCFWIFQYLGFEAMPIELNVQQMLILSAAALVVLSPSSPAMIGVFQGVMVGFLILFRVTDSATLTAYAILVFIVQLVLWIILGSWALFSTRLRFGSLIRQSRDILSKETKSVERLDNPGQESG